MTVKRIVPDVSSIDPRESVPFYRDFLGLDLAMDLGWVLTFASASHPAAQVTILQSQDASVPAPDFSIEVQDIHLMYADAQARGLPIIYPLTVEPWGVTRFFTQDPNGKIINLLSHS